MKKTLVSIFITLLLISTFYLPNTFAQYQDYMQFSLPEGAKARLGKGWISGDIAYSPDGTRLAVSSSIGIWIYDANTYTEVALFTGHTATVNSVAFSPDGRTLVSGSSDNTVRLWDTNTGQLLHTLEDHNQGVDDVAFSPDGKMFGSIDGGEDIRLWNADTFQLLHTFGIRKSYFGSVGSVNCLAFSSDSKWVAVGYYFGQIYFWDVNTGKYLGSTGHINYSGINSIAFSSDGITLASGGGDGSVRLLGARTREHWQKVGSHGDDVNSVVFSPDGKILASGGSDNKIALWDAFTGEHLRTLEEHTSPVLGISFSRDGKTLTSASWTEIRFWDANTGQLLHTIEGHTRTINSIALSPDGSTLASGREDGMIQLWDPHSGKFLHILEGHTGTINSVSFSSDGSMLASGDGSGMIRLWNVLTREHLHTFDEHWQDRRNAGSSRRMGLPAWSINSVAFSPNSNMLASGSNDQTVRLWDIHTKKHLHTLKEQLGWVDSIAFSPDGETLISGHQKERILLWHVRIGRRLRSIPAGQNEIYSIALSPDGETLASGGRHDTVRLWNPRSGEFQHTFKGHTNSIASIVFSPDGSTLASASWEIIRLWDVHTKEHLHTLRGHANWVYSVVFFPDSSTLASGGFDGTILLWELTPPEPPRLAEDVNNDGTVNIQDLVAVAAALGETSETPADVNGDGIVNIQDLVAVAAALGETVASAPSAANLRAETVQQWLSDANQLNLTDATSQRGIRFLEQLLLTLTPKETALLANYPNPFNPETWIPYQLASPADVTLHIHAVDGTLVRTLSLGHRATGVYQSRSRAAYWDGKNEVGESIASGVYFYTLTAEDFTATRKMLIRK